MKTQRGSRGIDLPFFFNFGAGCVGSQRHDPAGFLPGNRPVPIVQEAGWVPGPIWTSVDKI